MNQAIPNVSVSTRKSTRYYDLEHQETVRRQLRQGIWAYFILLIFEGALRKWVLPMYNTPLLVVRDPIVLWLLAKALRNNEMPKNWYISAMVIVTIMSVFTSLTVGHCNLIIALYGARIFWFHFPVMFLIGRVFTREDIEKMGRALLVIALPMIVLVAVQFYSPQSALVNRGVGGDTAGGGFSGALGFFRPPGTFSFTTGNTQFWSLVGVFIIYFWLNPKLINRWLLFAATAALIVAIPLSISRSLFFQTGLSLVFLAIAIARRPQYLKQVFTAAIALVFMMLLLDRVSYFHQAIEALTTRFTAASESEGGLEGTLIDRFLGGLLGAVQSNEQPFFGYGIGMGTNVAARILTGRVDVFLIAEEEWGRLVGEMGTLLGVAVIVIRVHLCFKLAKAGFDRLMKNDFLPWIFVSLAIILVAQAQWAQPTALGFSTLAGGLLLASLREPASKDQ